MQRNLMTELALDPSDESLLVSREKVNGHIYHMFKDAQVTLPEPVGGRGTQHWVGRASKGGWQMLSSPPSSHPFFQLSILSEEQIRSAQLRIQESSGIVLSPQVLQPMFRPMQSSSEGEGETPCGSDQGLEQLTDVSGSNVEVYAEEEVNVSEVCVCVCVCVHHCPLNGLLYMSLPFADHDTHQRSPLPHWTGGQQNTGQVGEPWLVYCGGALTHTTLAALHLTTPHSLHSTSYHHPHTPLPSTHCRRKELPWQPMRFAVSFVSLTTRRTPAAVWKRCRS